MKVMYKLMMFGADSDSHSMTERVPKSNVETLTQRQLNKNLT